MKHYDFSNGERHPSSSCTRWCKVHYYWDFDLEAHVPLPTTFNYKGETGWHHVTVYVGPPGYLPKKPNDSQWNSMLMVCPHEQMSSTCNTCFRHIFHPLEIQ